MVLTPNPVNAAKSSLGLLPPVLATAPMNVRLGSSASGPAEQVSAPATPTAAITLSALLVKVRTLSVCQQQAKMSIIISSVNAVGYRLTA